MNNTERSELPIWCRPHHTVSGDERRRDRHV